MLKSIVFTFLVLFAAESYSQTAMPYSEGRTKFNMRELDSLHKSGAHADSTQSAFPLSQDEYLKAYEQMLKDLSRYLDKNGFSFGKPTKCSHKIYFNEDGTIKYYFYTFRDLEPAKEKQFGELLPGFIKTYKFPMKSEIPFRQCGSATYVDTSKK